MGEKYYRNDFEDFGETEDCIGIRHQSLIIPPYPPNSLSVMLVFLDVKLLQKANSFIQFNKVFDLKSFSLHY